eukprot:COSAG06_NODE_5422_length_3492_cov_2.015915_2_plen_52_part_00
MQARSAQNRATAGLGQASETGIEIGIARSSVSALASTLGGGIFRDLVLTQA